MLQLLAQKAKYYSVLLAISRAHTRARASSQRSFQSAFGLATR